MVKDGLEETTPVEKMIFKDQNSHEIAKAWSRNEKRNISKHSSQTIDSKEPSTLRAEQTEHITSVNQSVVTHTSTHTHTVCRSGDTNSKGSRQHSQLSAKQVAVCT